MNQTWSLEDLYRTIARHWRTVVVVAVAAIVGSVVVNFLYPERYESTAVLTVEPITALQTDGAPTPVNMETERVVATSTEVLSMAVADVPDASVRSLQESVEVSVPRDSQVLYFRFTASEPELAATAANAIAEAYNAQRVANAQRVVTEATDNLELRVGELTEQLDGLSATSPDRRNLELQLEVLQERLATYSSATFSSGSLISPAVAPADSTKPSIAVFLAAGIFLGVLVGTFAALLRGRSPARGADSSPAEVMSPSVAREAPAPQETRKPGPPASSGGSGRAVGTVKASPQRASQKAGRTPATTTPKQRSAGSNRTSARPARPADKA